MEKQKLRYYTILVLFSFIFGIVLAFLFSILLINYNPSSANKTEILTLVNNNYVNFQIPELSNSFFTIFKGNFIASITVLLLPGILLIFVIFLISKLKTWDRINAELNNTDLNKFFKLFLKYMILLISVSYAFRSFGQKNMFEYFSILPLDLALISFLHGIFEIPAMIIPSIMSLYTVDTIYEINQANGVGLSKLKWRKLIFELLGIIFLLFILLIIAAYVECYITPNAFQQALERYLSNH